MLSAAKHLSPVHETLRFAQGDISRQKLAKLLSTYYTPLNKVLLVEALQSCKVAIYACVILWAQMEGVSQPASCWSSTVQSIPFIELDRQGSKGV